MKFLKNYKKFLESIQIDVSVVNIDMNESLSLYYENILKSIGAEEIDLYDTFILPKENFKIDIESLNNSTEFINSLSSIGLKKSSVQNTEDYDTFVSKPCRFIMIYRIEANELENPEYILFQSWNETIDKWDTTKLYRIKSDIKDFYDKLSTKEIEIEHNGEKFKYQSKNKNEWELKDQTENDTFKKYFRSDELEQAIKDNKVRLTIL